MKKTILSSMMVGAMALTLGVLFNVPAHAACPVKTPCEKKCDKPAQPPMECKKLMTPEEKAKFREEKKAEFESRLQLTDQQKAQLEKIKADEQKKLEPNRAKIKKEQEKLDKLFDEQRAIRKESVKKFEAALTDEQKEELKKIKEEVREEMKKMAPKRGPHDTFNGPKGPHNGHGPKMGQKPCMPDCQCPCHKK